MELIVDNAVQIGVVVKGIYNKILQMFLYYTLLPKKQFIVSNKFYTTLNTVIANNILFCITVLFKETHNQCYIL